MILHYIKVYLAYCLFIIIDANRLNNVFGNLLR